MRWSWGLRKTSRLLGMGIVAYAGATTAAMLLLDARTPCASLIELQLRGIREAGVAISAEEAERYRSDPLVGSDDRGEMLSVQLVCALSWWYPLFQDDDAHRATWSSYRAHAPPFRGGG